MKKAFTLIELLVVIAIIAILAAILFPVFAQAKAAAKQTASLSNVKQIMTAHIMYAGDADDQQNPNVWRDRGDGEWITWMEDLNPYVKSKEMFLSTGQSTAQATYGQNCNAVPGATVTSHWITPNWVPYSYYNWWGDVMFAGFPVPPTAENTKTNGTCANLPAWAACVGFTQAAQPADTAVIIPGFMVTYPRPTKGTVFGYPCYTAFDAEHGKPNKVNTNVHAFREGGNYGMADGHAKWFSSKNMNGNKSRPHAYGGANYPSSPYMVLVD